MKRRHFIINTAAASAFTGFAGSSLMAMQPKASKHITILHTNDVHSHIEPFPSNDPNYANLGGVSRRLTLIEAVRKENPIHCSLMPAIFFRARPILIFMVANSNSSS